MGCSTMMWWALHEYCEPDPLLIVIPLPFDEPQVCLIHFWSCADISLASQDLKQTYTHTVAVIAPSITREKASLVDAFHGAVVCIVDTHSLNAITRARCWLRILGTTDTTLLRISALVGGL